MPIFMGRPCCWRVYAATVTDVDDAYLAYVLAIALKGPARVIVLLGGGENSTQGGGR
jgi:hypothetical protein